MRVKFNDGQWTEARYKGFIKSSLRSSSIRWPPRYTVLKEAATEKKTNVKTGRLAQHFKCNRCQEDFPQKEVEVNHKEAVIPVTGFDTWDGVIERMFCEKDQLEVVCKPCHKLITQGENAQRKLNAK